MSDRFRRVLIANRGEIAIRIAQAVSDMGNRSVAVFSEDDASSLHTQKADVAVPLNGRGVKAYLDQEQLIKCAIDNGCDAIHPGYGFLSENSGFARQCKGAGICFIGPSAEVLDLLGDKAEARALAMRCDVPLVEGVNHSVSQDEAEEFFYSLDAGAAVMIKPLAGGGGRGMRAVDKLESVADAYDKCKAEATLAFGRGDLYIERYIPSARHIEIQVIGDGTGAVNHLWERECTLQRRNQKLIEVAPSPTLDESTREAIVEAALRLAAEVRYQGLGTFEFLLDAQDSSRFYFMEANPRIQVEHTVTEEITNIDLVKTQLQLAAGESLENLQLTQVPVRTGTAVQLRLNMESMSSDGTTTAAAGTLTAYHMPTGRGIRVDGYGYTGYQISPGYDSLLAKLIVKGSDYSSAMSRAYRALCELKIEGVENNKLLLLNLLQSPEVLSNDISTQYVETRLTQLLKDYEHPELFFDSVGTQPGAVVAAAIPEHCQGIFAVSAGVLVSLNVKDGDEILIGQEVAQLEAMKMEFPVNAGISGVITRIFVAEGEALAEGQLLLIVEPSDVSAGSLQSEEEFDIDYIRADLSEVIERHQKLTDERRPQAVAKRRVRNMRTARKNVNDLLDEGSFSEYGAMALSVLREHLSEEELVNTSPADGMVCGAGTVNANLFGNRVSRCVVLAYDYTVFAGTQGFTNHKKTDRMLEMAYKWRTPVVLFAEGGGGRPNDFQGQNGASHLDCNTFAAMAKLSGLVPTIGIAAGRCFAGNAALLGVCDVIIATKSACIGMGGPAMIEGGGLGSYQPEEVGPVSVQAPNGVIDVLAEDEEDAVALAKTYLSYFQGDTTEWHCDDQRKLRHVIPENRMRIYDIHEVVSTLADTDSVLVLRSQFAPGMITAFIRIEGRAFGVIANNPAYLGGAIDAACGDKASRFIQLCDAFDIPLISLCDTPGFMVGPEAEKQATVRHISRLFVMAASTTVPFFTVVLRKAYGLGAQAMAAGGFHAPDLTAAWPCGEFGAMGVEGGVRLAHAKQLGAIADSSLREELFDDLVADVYKAGKATNVASYIEIDTVIDPMETRGWIIRGLNATPEPSNREGKKRPCIDTW